MAITESMTTAKRNEESYLTYSAVKGYFLQDEEDTDASRFDYVAKNFGLINRKYDYEEGLSARHKGHEDAAEETKPMTQWAGFEQQVRTLNGEAGPNVQYKVLYLGRHGEGFHNVAQNWYGDEAWDCYWSMQDGNETSTWSDAKLTEVGKAQAQTAHDAWWKQIENEIPFPEIFYVSPLNRCLQTAFITFYGLEKDIVKPFTPTVKEEYTPATVARANQIFKENTQTTLSKRALLKKTSYGSLNTANQTLCVTHASRVSLMIYSPLIATMTNTLFL
ncbi:conserved hypothetical protein [Talaromyces stipitatus ATCC 10500]|uniref:Phosphoglycerate mutase family protein n=1 Tax=Talaromyces stipitatus (strain ATCC 10500 / CBS 375.48 / QM 6759 / NRRL 1006) TaxID=441959 RepID=B8MKH3_TALSN|nr:uncharacterized protein TSTA_047740 [Talaromyces stipitatus ATCC 10500]EED15328.1 conserved hypothetical protein [Talaromyces stipitatus ATCC 10500]